MTISSSTIAVYAGTAVTTTATFTNPGTSAPIDPTSVTLVYRLANETPTTWIYGSVGGISRVDTGVYAAQLDTTNLPGWWVTEWIGTGACAVVQPAEFQVTPRPF